MGSDILHWLNLFPPPVFPRSRYNSISPLLPLFIVAQFPKRECFQQYPGVRLEYRGPSACFMC